MREHLTKFEPGWLVPLQCLVQKLELSGIYRWPIVFRLWLLDAWPALCGDRHLLKPTFFRKLCAARSEGVVVVGNLTTHEALCCSGECRWLQAINCH